MTATMDRPALPAFGTVSWELMPAHGESIRAARIRKAARAMWDNLPVAISAPLGAFEVGVGTDVDVVGIRLVPGMEAVDTCRACAGEGALECGDCDGTGEVGCSALDCVDGRVECYERLGRKAPERDCPKDCEECAGEQKVDCERCDGDGVVECFDCLSGLTTCHECGGEGIAP